MCALRVLGQQRGLVPAILPSEFPLLRTKFALRYVAMVSHHDRKYMHLTGCSWFAPVRALSELLVLPGPKPLAIEKHTEHALQELKLETAPGQWTAQLARKCSLQWHTFTHHHNTHTQEAESYVKTQRGALEDNKEGIEVGPICFDLRWCLSQTGK